MLILACAPLLMIYSAFFSMHVFEQLLWGLLGWVLIGLFTGGDRRWWLVAGVLAGIGLQTRLTVGLFGLTLALALLLTSARAHLKTWHIWAGGAIALAIFLPHIWWQSRHDWPALEYVSNVQGVEEFWTTLILLSNPLSLPIWLGGIGLVLFHSGYRCYLPIVLVGVASIGALGFLGGKAYYAAPALVMLAPFGGVAYAKFWKSWPKCAALYSVLILAVGILFIHVATPIYPMESYKPVVPPLAPVTHAEMSDVEIPFPLQLRLGWEEMGHFMAARLEAFPEVNRDNAIIYSDYYGVAAGLMHYGPELGLPPVYSTHNQFFLWGPPSHDFEFVIVDVFFPHNLLLPLFFEEISYIGTFEHAYMPQHLAIRKYYLCSKPLFDLAETWIALRDIS